MDLDNEKDTAMGEFEDEFEDEFDDDEIIEAGVDGRPDAEREAEEKEGVWCIDGRGLLRLNDCEPSSFSC